MKITSVKENKIHSTGEKCFSYYMCKIPEHFLNVPAHWHEEFELIYVREGKALYRVGEEEFVSGSGDIILIAPNEIHSIYQENENKQIYDTIVFNSEAFGLSKRERGFGEYIIPLMVGSRKIVHRITPEIEGYETLKILVLEAVKSAEADQVIQDLLLKSSLSRLLWHLIEEHCVRHNRDVPQSALGMEFLRATLQYISLNYTSTLSIAQLAKMNHCSESTFMAHFRKSIGITALEYIIQIRIQAACDLLKNSDQTVLEIALEVGFVNLSNFNRHFKRVVGMAPREYRKNES